MLDHLKQFFGTILVRFWWLISINLVCKNNLPFFDTVTINIYSDSRVDTGVLSRQ